MLYVAERTVLCAVLWVRTGWLSAEPRTQHVKVRSQVWLCSCNWLQCAGLLQALSITPHVIMQLAFQLSLQTTQTWGGDCIIVSSFLG
jgi:hypothetical protein